MYTYLIVDDEMVERKGIRMLLGRMGIRENVLEASNGEEALEVMKQQKVDILLTDINMPFMDGIELLSRVHESDPALETVIFSGYDEFSYAKKAISYGVSAYILKPVNPDEFEKTIRGIVERLDKSQMEEKRKDESISFLKEHILYLMVYGQSKASLAGKTLGILDLSFIKDYRRMMLLECSANCFEQVNEEKLLKIRDVLDMKFQYLNLNPSQSLLLFTEEAAIGWEALGRKLYFYLKEKFGWECFLAISEDMKKEQKELSACFAEVEQMMEQRFYHTGSHVFLPFREEQSEIYVQVDAEILIHQIQQDIRMKDIESLKDHFGQFVKRYEHQTVFSQVYIKFLFSNLLKEIYDNLEDTDERELDREIDQLYRSNDMNGVILAVRSGIARLEKVFASEGKGYKRREVEQIKQYIRANYQDGNLGVDQMAREVGMTPNYLSSIFKKETGENLSRYLKNFRMEKARGMLENTNEKIGEICQKCGFSNVSYFCQSFRECYGISPQKYRDQGE
ncbi:MAG: response regulator [Fusicatenibacter sp.]|nr:response regulator [Lachnospiraceae bacterium]MDY2938529.1 response regulator [Fusicatenibacter sp.]